MMERLPKSPKLPKCPRCGQPLVREVRDGKEVERCPRCPYRVWIVPLKRMVKKPRYGNLWPANGLER